MTNIQIIFCKMKNKGRIIAILCVCVALTTIPFCLGLCKISKIPDIKTASSIHITNGRTGNTFELTDFEDKDTLLSDLNAIGYLVGTHNTKNGYAYHIHISTSNEVYDITLIDERLLVMEDFVYSTHLDNIIAYIQTVEDTKIN